MEKPQRTAEDTENEDVSNSGSGSAEETAPVRKKKTRKGKKKSSSGALDKVGEVGGVENLADGALGGVTNTLGNVGGQALQQQQEGGGGGGKSDTLRLRLDLNLDIEIQLKARIHGDLELALLYVTRHILTYPYFLLPPTHYTLFPLSNLSHHVTQREMSTPPTLLS